MSKTTYITDLRNPDGTRWTYHVEADTWEEADLLATALGLGTVVGSLIRSERLEASPDPTTVPKGA